MTRWIVVLLLVLGLAGVAAGACSSQASQPEDDAAQATAITAEALYAAYREDAAAADARYKGKLLAVTGVVHSVGTDLILEAPQVVLTGGARNPARGVDCVFEERYKAQVAELAPGQDATVVGTCDGSYRFSVLLVDCRPGEGP